MKTDLTGIQCKNHIITVCNAQTGHTIQNAAFCEDTETAQALVEAVLLNEKLSSLLCYFMQLGLKDGNEQAQKAKDKFLRQCPEFLSYLKQARDLNQQVF